MARITKAHVLKLLADMPEPFSSDDYLEKLRAVMQLMQKVRQAVPTPEPAKPQP